jgi:hypothetical protein
MRAVAFLRTSDSSTRVRVLKALWDYRCAQQRRERIEEKVPDAQSEFDRLIARVSGSPGTTAKVTDTHKPVIQVVDPHVLTDQTVSSGIGVWTADVKNRDRFSSNRVEDAITSDDQMPNGNTQLFALRRERTSQWQ